MRILIAGGRDFNDFASLVVFMKPYRHLVTAVISGKARGADKLGEQWANLVGAVVEPYPADWEKHGKAAGPIRNKQMLDEGKPDLVVVFPGGVGSNHMATIAKKKGVEVIRPVWKLV